MSERVDGIGACLETVNVLFSDIAEGVGDQDGSFLLVWSWLGFFTLKRVSTVLAHHLDSLFFLCWL